MNRLVVSMVTCLFVPACIINADDDDGDDTAADGETGDGDEGDSSGDAAGAVLHFEFAGLEDLGPDYVYEGWVIADGQALTAGRFSVNGDGAADLTTFEFDAATAAATTKYVLTIEPAENDDPAPSKVHLVAGPFVDGMAELTVDDDAAIGTDFTDARGSFILETPTSEDPDDYANGIWWLDPAAGRSGFELPELPEGWAYEGWVVGADGPVSTGRFTAGNTEDSDGAGPTAGNLGAPAFPGQDFIDPPVSLVGHAAVLSVEPEPDNSPDPFTLKPLVTMSIGDVPPPDLQTMDNNAEATNPSGVAWFDG